MSYLDLFSKQASLYAQYRPHYPPELFAKLASLAPYCDTVWDCATGNGQAALGLAEHFQKVIASDASAQQLAHARPHPRVSYARGLAERAPLANGTCDMVTVSQAAHWFYLDEFYQEVRRVLKPGGLVALWGYGQFSIDEEIDHILIGHFYNEITEPYWEAGRRFIDEEYRTLPFPFDEIEMPPIEMQACWTLEGVVGLLSSWSAVQKFQRERGYNPITEIWDLLSAAWGDPSTERDIRWPVFMRVGRI